MLSLGGYKVAEFATILLIHSQKKVKQKRLVLIKSQGFYILKKELKNEFSHGLSSRAVTDLEKLERGWFANLKGKCGSLSEKLKHRR